MGLRETAIKDILVERENQPPFDDDENRQGLWSAYISNYCTRWAMPYSFKTIRENRVLTTKYNFRSCMVKAAALALAAIEWHDNCDAGESCTVDEEQAHKVSKPVIE